MLTHRNTQNMYIIECKKNSKQDSRLWCFDYDFGYGVTVTNEPLMEAATELIDDLLIDKYNEVPMQISITFDWLELPGADAVFLYQGKSSGGFVYLTTELLGVKADELMEREIWLCSVLTHFFKEPPEQLYVYIEREDDVK